MHKIPEPVLKISCLSTRGKNEVSVRCIERGGGCLSASNSLQARVRFAHETLNLSAASASGGLADHAATGL